jgi:hypothetical protein
MSGGSALTALGAAFNEMVRDAQPWLDIKSLVEVSSTAEKFVHGTNGLSPRHPVEVLEGLGGRSGRRRPISTVYKIIYMPREQVLVHRGGDLYIHDIMAYPLFVASH